MSLKNKTKASRRERPSRARRGRDCFLNFITKIPRLTGNTALSQFGGAQAAGAKAPCAIAPRSVREFKENYRRAGTKNFKNIVPL
jgi:hypothetical protein